MEPLCPFCGEPSCSDDEPCEDCSASREEIPDERDADDWKHHAE